jgi:hypothetical protein
MSEIVRLAFPTPTRTKLLPVTLTLFFLVPTERLDATYESPLLMALTLFELLPTKEKSAEPEPRTRPAEPVVVT